MKQWGELPTEIPSPLGPVRVVRATQKQLGKKCVGDFHTVKRRIRVLDTLTGVVAWQVLYHEWTHMVVHDVGLHPHIQNEFAEEVLCDAISNALCLWQTTNGKTLG